MDRFGMSQRRDDALGSCDGLTNRAIRLRGQSCFGTGGLDGNTCYLLMTQSGDNILRDSGYMADRTVFACGQAGFRTGGGHGCIIRFDVSRGGDLLGLNLTAGTTS